MLDHLDAVGLWTWSLGHSGTSTGSTTSTSTSTGIGIPYVFVVPQQARTSRTCITGMTVSCVSYVPPTAPRVAAE